MQLSLMSGELNFTITLISERGLCSHSALPFLYLGEFCGSNTKFVYEKRPIQENAIWEWLSRPLLSSLILVSFIPACVLSPFPSPIFGENECRFRSRVTLVCGKKKRQSDSKMTFGAEVDRTGIFKLVLRT